MENKKNKEKKNGHLLSLQVFFYVVLILLSLSALGFIASVYLTTGISNTAVGRVVSRVLPLPAAVVNYSNFISIKEVEEDMKSIQSFYENQDFSSVGMRVDFTTEDGAKRLQMKKKQLLNKLIEDKAIYLLAKKNGIMISQSDLDASVSKKLEEYGTEEDVVLDLKNLYGWSLDDFKEKVVLPDLYRQALYKQIEGELVSKAASAKEKIEKASKELEEGKDFAQVAEKYSEGASADNGGEIGWVKKDQIVPQLADKIFSFNHDRKTIIESDLGFHLAEVEDVKKEDGQDVIRVRQIFVRKPIFADWLSDQMRLISVKIPLRDLYWNEDSLGVEFSDEEMRKFESEAKENYKGDASVYF